MSTEPEKPKVAIELLSQHAVWLATMLWFSLVAVKALRVAKMNPQTTLAILGTSEVVSVAFFVLVATIPLLFATLGLAALGWGFGSIQERGLPERVAAVSVYLLALAFTAVIAPLVNTILLLLLAVSVPAVQFYVRRKAAAPRKDPPIVVDARAVVDEGEALQVEFAQIGEITEATDLAQVSDVVQRMAAMTERLGAMDDQMAEHARVQLEGQRRKRDITRATYVATVALQSVAVAVVILQPTPWLPAERLDVPGGERVGYVIAEGDWMTVLDEDSRMISRVRTSDVKNRTICQRHSADILISRSALDVVLSNNAPAYPPCDHKK